VGNGIDDSASARAAVARRRAADVVTVLYTGRFVDRKGIQELLESAARILRASPNVRFVLAGGHRGCSGEDMASRWLPPACEPFRHRILFTGWLSPEDMNRWYQAADILVVPSWYEPFGMVILEGMLHGLAIVASDVGGPRAILDDGATGLLCRPRDVDSLERALLRVIDDPRLRDSLGHNAARDVRHQWSFNRIVCQMAAVYAEMATVASPDGRQTEVDESVSPILSSLEVVRD
jgi:glycosyltransferase involved in cell wall biosynthesis